MCQDDVAGDPDRPVFRKHFNAIDLLPVDLGIRRCWSSALATDRRAPSATMVSSVTFFDSRLAPAVRVGLSRVVEPHLHFRRHLYTVECRPVQGDLAMVPGRHSLICFFELEDVHAAWCAAERIARERLLRWTT